MIGGGWLLYALGVALAAAALAPELGHRTALFFTGLVLLLVGRDRINDPPTMKYTKKPVTVEAVQITANPDFSNFPLWLKQAMAAGDVSIVRDAITGHVEMFVVETLEGRVSGGVRDWIIQGVEGELYPCKESVFEVTYE